MIKIYESIAKWAISKLHDEFIKRGSIVLSTVHLEVKQHQIHDIKDKKEFYLLCDNSACQGAKMLPKEGDSAGIAPIKERLQKDQKLIEQAFSLYGIPKILLRNSLPVKSAKNYVDNYEITPEYSYVFNEKENKIETLEKPWQINDDEGISSNSLMPPPVVVSLIKQLAQVLGI